MNTETQKAVETIKAELTKAANILGNAGIGKAEKTLEVTFGNDKNSIRINAGKFFDAFGKPIDNPNAISEETGRLLAKAELSKAMGNLSKRNESELMCSPKGIKNLFSNVVLKNSLDKVKENWSGFSSDVDNFLTSLPEAKHPELSLEKLTENWLHNESIPVKAKEILDELAEELKTSKKPIEITKQAFSNLKEILESDEPELPPVGETGDDEGDGNEENENPHDGENPSNETGESESEDGNDSDDESEDGSDSEDESEDGNDSDDESEDGSDSEDESEDGSDSEDESEDGNDSEDESEDGSDSEDGNDSDDESDDESDSEDGNDSDDESDDESESEDGSDSDGESDDESESESESEDGSDSDGESDSESDSDSESANKKPKVMEETLEQSIWQKVMEEPTPVEWLEVKPETKKVGDPFVSKLQIHQLKATLKNKASYKAIALSLRSQVAIIRNSFAFRNNKMDRYDFGKTTGDIDQNGLHKFGMKNINLFATKECPKSKDVTIGILLDQSQSMQTNRRDVLAREVVITLVEALKTIKGINLVVYGHTADRNSGHTLDMLPYIDKQAGIDNSAMLEQACGLYQNHDGFAIRFMQQRMIANNPISKNHVHKLFMLTDGMPCGYDYREEGLPHTTRCVKEIRKAGIDLFAIGIDNAFPKESGESLYGKDGFVIINDVKSSLAILARQIKKLFTK